MFMTVYLFTVSGLIFLYLLIAICSILYAVIKMCSPGVSREMSSLIIKRHVFGTLCYIITNSYCWLSILYLFNKDYREERGNIDVHFDWVLTLKVCFAFQGFCIPLSRISEPYFFRVVASEIRSLCS